MGVELPESACPRQEESSREKQKHNYEEEKSISPEETSIVVHTEALLVDSRSDLVLKKSHPELYVQIQELNGNCDQSGESNFLPLKKRQRVQESGEESEGIEIEYIDVNNGLLGSTEKNQTTINNGENNRWVDSSGEMALCLANEARLDIDNSVSCIGDINGNTLCHSDPANCSEPQNGNSGVKAVKRKGEAVLVQASLETASADTPAISAGMEPMLRERDFRESPKLHNQEDATQEVEASKSTALETEENKDNAEVEITEECTPVVEVPEATSKRNGGALLSTASSQENQIMEVDIKNQSILSAPQDPSIDEVMQNDTVSKEDACQSLLKGSSHVSAPEDSKKKLLILDLNGLLADIIPYCNERYKYDFEVSHKYVYKRPHVDDFLHFCFERFTVAVWSSRTKRNIDPLLELLIGPLQTKLLFCWDQSHCTQTRFPTVDNKEKPLVFKELSKVWENCYDNLPGKKVQYNESNTLLLDDSPYKALLNPANTAVFPVSYRYTRVHDNSFGPGGDLRLYLEGLAVSDNVQAYVKKNPFGQKPITESDPSWHYYQRVLRSYSHLRYSKETLHSDAGKCSQRDDAGKFSHSDETGKCSHHHDAGKCSHPGDDAGKWSHHGDDAQDETGRWSHHGDDAGRWSHHGVDAGRWSHRGVDTVRWSHRGDDTVRWSHHGVDTVRWSHRGDDAGKWSHHGDDAGRWSHRYDDRKWSQHYDDRKWSHRDDGRRWSRDNVIESRYADARKLPRDNAREPRRDYA